MAGDPILPPRARAATDARARARVLTAEQRAPKITASTPAPIRPGDVAVAPGSWWETFATAPDWVRIWVSWTPVLSRVGIKTTFGVVCNDAAADGDVRIRITNGAGLDRSTDAQTLNAAGPHLVTFNWLHGEEPWEHRDVTIALEALVRTAGAGFGVFSPYAGAFLLTDGTDATLTGV